MPSFAAIFDRLVDRHRKPGGRPYSNQDIASALAEHGVEVTQSYIWMLRRGERVDPRASVLVGLGRVFGIPAGYFLDVETYRRIERQWADQGVEEKIPVMREKQVLLRQVTELSPEISDLFGELIGRVRELENRSDA
jgi:ESX-1-secreted protein regulator